MCTHIRYKDNGGGEAARGPGQTPDRPQPAETLAAHLTIGVPVDLETVGGNDNANRPLP